MSAPPCSPRQHRRGSFPSAMPRRRPLVPHLASSSHFSSSLLHSSSSPSHQYASVATFFVAFRRSVIHLNTPRCLVIIYRADADGPTALESLPVPRTLQKLDIYDLVSPFHHARWLFTFTVSSLLAPLHFSSHYTTSSPFIFIRHHTVPLRHTPLTGKRG